MDEVNIIGKHIWDNAEVSGDAQVYGNARVSDNARVSGNAWVYVDARVSDTAWVYGNAVVYGNARVSDNAWVYGNAWVSGNARVSGDAEVYGNAWVSGNAYIVTGIIDGEARIESPNDLVQAIIDGDVWSRFRTQTGYRTTCTDPDAVIAEHLAAFFDAWEANRG